MLSTDYYRRQADVCVRLSVVQSDEVDLPRFGGQKEQQKEDTMTSDAVA
jgi:hypothetical protein